MNLQQGEEMLCSGKTEHKVGLCRIGISVQRLHEIAGYSGSAVILYHHIPSLSDFDEKIMKTLQSRAYELFEWLSRLKNIPKYADCKSFPWLKFTHVDYGK